MYLLKLKNNSNSTRHQVNIKKALVSKKSRIIKSLNIGSKTSSGRSLTGRITIGHKGAGVKKIFRDMRFNPSKNFSLLITVFYDSRRSAFVSLFYNFLTFKFFNCLHTLKTFPGSFLFSYKTYPELALGSLNILRNIPGGSCINNLFINNIHPQYIKSAGTFGIIVQKDLSICTIKLPSGLLKKINLDVICFIGKMSNSHHEGIVWGKAGRSRLKNKRPKVRGVAMNPVDHPHGGQTSGGIPSVTPWGIPTKGKPTKKKHVKI